MSKFKPNSVYTPSRALSKRGANGSAVAATAVLSPETIDGAGLGETAEEDAPPQNPLQRIGFNVMLLYVFFRFSFLHEFISGKVGVDTHIIVALSLILYICTLASGRIGEAFRDKITWMWLGFGLCMFVATITSFWQGGSFPILIAYLRTALPVIVIIPALTITRRDVTRIVNVIGLACMTTVFLGLINNDFKTGRMGLATTGSEIQDSNDYAAHLILMLPALVYLTMRPGKSMVMKALGAAFIAASVYQILSTGSRGGLLSLALTALFIVFIGSMRLRVMILVGIPLLGLLAIPLIPHESAVRLQTLFSKTDNTQSDEASESSQARLALLQRSWNISVHHPLFGIGPGEFMDFEAESAKETGQRGMWHVTHNAYTQVSSECGIPALLLFLSALVMTFSVFRKASARPQSILALPAAILSVMLVGFGVCIFFLSLAYTVQMVVLGAVAICMRSIMRAEQESAVKGTAIA